MPSRACPSSRRQVHGRSIRHPHLKHQAAGLRVRAVRGLPRGRARRDDEPSSTRCAPGPPAAFVGRVIVLQLRLWRMPSVHARVRGRACGTRTASSTGAARGCSGSNTRRCPAISRSQDGLRGAEVRGRRRGRLPVACPPACVRRGRVMGADRLPAVRPARAGALLPQVLCPDRAADRIVAGAALQDLGAGCASADTATAELSEEIELASSGSTNSVCVVSPVACARSSGLACRNPRRAISAT